MWLTLFWSYSDDDSALTLVEDEEYGYTSRKTVKRLRQERGITQEQLGNYLGISFQAISKWENGTTLPDISLLPKLAIFFGRSIDDLFSIDLEDHLKRIDTMLQDDFRYSSENLNYASRILKQAIADTPQDSELYRRLADVTVGNSFRDIRASIVYIEEAIHLAPYNHVYHLKLQDARKRLLEPEQLVIYYRKFIECYPDWPDGYGYLALALLDDKKPHRALDILQKGLEKFPNDSDLRYFKGDVELVYGNMEKAIAAWKGVLDENLNSWTLVNRTAEHLAELEYYEEAFVLWERALEIDPNNGAPLYSAAFAYETIGMYDKAIGKWEQIIALCKNTYDIHEGEIIDWPKREITKLQTQSSSTDTPR